MNNFKSFDFLCRCLSRQVVKETDSSGLLKEIKSGSVNWQKVIPLADRHYVLPLLHSMLAAKGLTNALPTDLQETLSSLHELNCQRNEKLKQQLTEVVQRLNTAEIIPVLLKGATSLFTTLYPDSGCRIMGDLDLLVPEDRLEECAQLLHKDGYAPLEKQDLYREHHHSAPLGRPDRIGAVELHRQLAVEPVAQLLNADTVRARAITRHCDGVKFQLCCDTHLAMHNILHHQLSGIDLYDRRTFSLYQVYDLVQLMHLPDNTIPWKTIFEHFQEYGYARETSSYFILVKQLFRQPLPPGVPKLYSSRLDWFLAKSQLASPAAQYYFQIWVHLLKHPEQRKNFFKQLCSLSSYRTHFRRLAGHIRWH